MNTISNNNILRTLVVGVLLTINGCDIPGPWEYDVADVETYRGIYASGYVVADRPVKEICFEKLHALSEVYSLEFPFYDSATVVIYSGSDTVVLTPQNDIPNCFEGPTEFIPQRGTDYSLSAIVYWDSLGSAATTTITGVAQVPTEFTLSDTARYQYPDLRPPPSDYPGRLVYLFTLDSEVRDSVLVRFNIDPSLVDVSQFTPGAGQPQTPVDSASAQFVETFITENWDSIYTSIVYYDTSRVKTVYYANGDTINYLYDGQNLSSHFFPSTYSDDVGSVLVTHSFTDSALFPETAFSNLFGGRVGEAKNSYFSGTIRQLISYDNTISETGELLFDKIPASNYWFVGGHNRVFIYGLEPFYHNYVVTAISNEDDSKVNAVYNIEGAKGFFVGAVVDTFDFFMQVNYQRDYYTTEETYIDFCNDGMYRGNDLGGWDGNKDCRTYLPTLCTNNDFLYKRCAELMIEENLLNGRDTLDWSSYVALWELKVDSLSIEIVSVDSESDAFNELKAEVKGYTNFIEDTTYMKSYEESGINRYCAHNNFPTPDCDSLYIEAVDFTKSSDIQEKLVTFCSDNDWDRVLYPQCGPGLVVYVNRITKEGNFSTVLEREVENYCSTNENEQVCINREI